MSPRYYRQRCLYKVQLEYETCSPMNKFPMRNELSTWSSTLSDWMSFHSSIVWARSTMHRGTFTSPIWSEMEKKLVIRSMMNNWARRKDCLQPEILTIKDSANCQVLALFSARVSIFGSVYCGQGVTWMTQAPNVIIVFGHVQEIVLGF